MNFKKIADTSFKLYGPFLWMGFSRLESLRGVQNIVQFVTIKNAKYPDSKIRSL